MDILPSIEDFLLDYSDNYTNTYSAPNLSLQSAIASATEPYTKSLLGVANPYLNNTGYTADYSANTSTNNPYTLTKGYVGELPELEDTGLRSVKFTDRFVDDTGTSYSSGISNSTKLGVGFTMASAGIASLLNTLSSRDIYKLYEQQEQLYIENATIQANRIELQGKLALADLKAQHALSEGKNTLSVAASGAGALSGSFLDKLMANRKYDTREEYASSLSTLYAVDNAKREGLIQALSVASQATQKAYAARNSAITSMIQAASSAVGMIAKDLQQSAAIDAKRYATQTEAYTTLEKTLESFAYPKSKAVSYTEGAVPNVVYGEEGESINIGKIEQMSSSGVLSGTNNSWLDSQWGITSDLDKLLKEGN